MSRTATNTPPPPPVLDADLKKLMRALKLGRMLDTLSERLAPAKQQSLPYAESSDSFSPSRSNAATGPGTRPDGARRP